jgi:hypothetical protein
MTVNPLPAALAAHADTLLAGTGLTAQDATRIAADPAAAVPPAGVPAAAALRDGWAAANDGEAGQ